MKHQKIQSKMRICSLFIVFFTVTIGFSQNYKGDLDTIQKDGLHKIMLTTEVRAATKNNFNYLRVKDAKGNAIPYVLVTNNDRNFATFKPIKILNKKVIKDSITSIVLENKKGKKQSKITLQITNTSVIKTYSIYGSKDGVNWFGLVSNRRLNYSNLPSKTTIEKTINFPLNTYKFLRINFNDKNSLPINIFGAGVYESKIVTQNPIEVSEYKVNAISIPERKVTQLNFTAKKAHYIDYISFDIDTEFYLRNVKIFVVKTRKRNKRTETYEQIISLIKLNSKYKNTFTFNNLNEKVFTIEIDNQDNPPLDISKIQLLQKPVYLITNINKHENYEIVIDTTLAKPSYDLGNFISNTTNIVNETTISNFIKIKQETIIDKKLPFWQTKLFMWSCIVLGGLFVVYFAIKLLGDVNNQQS